MVKIIKLLLFVGLFGIFGQFNPVFSIYCARDCGMIPPKVKVFVGGMRMYESKAADWENSQNLDGMEIRRSSLGLKFYYIFFPGKEKPHYFYVGGLEEPFCLDGASSGRIEINVYFGRQGTSVSLILLEEDFKIDIINDFWSDDESDVYLASKTW